MPIMRYLLPLALTLLLALPLLAAPGALPPPIIPDCLGVNIHFTGQPEQDLNGLVSGGFGWVRMDFNWAQIEKIKGVYDFSAYDSLLAGLTARHIHALFILDYENPLYGTGAPSTPEARAAFARFAAAAAVRFRGKSIIWEIWNEPNGPFWPPAPNVADYGALALATAHAIHAADPDATVIAPGMAGMDLAFLKSLCQQGLLPELDAVSFHPYRASNPETAGADYTNVRMLLHQYSPDRTIPLVCSEWGYSTTGVSEVEQAQYLTREWLYNLSQGIRLSIWYDWHDDGTDPNNGENNFGTVNFSYTPKPSFLAARTLTHTLDGYRFLKQIPLASPEDYLLLFSKGPDKLKLAAWTAGTDHSLFLPIPQVKSMTAMTGESLTPTITKGLLNLPLTGSPMYLSVSDDPALRDAAQWNVTAVDPFYRQNQPLQFSLTYHNPDAIAHRVRFEILLTAPSGTVSSVPGGSDLVLPGQTLSLEEMSSAFAHVAVHARVGLRLDGILQPYPQDVFFTPMDPILLTASPAPEGKMTVQISNPSGDAFTGHVMDGAGGKAFLVHLSDGQTEDQTPALPSSEKIVLLDSQGRTAADLPVQKMVPYPTDPSHVPVVLDGNRQLPSTAEAIPQANAEQVVYHFAPGWSFWRASEEKPPVLLGKPNSYGVWVSSDGSGNKITIRYEDATGQVFQDEDQKLDWKGWRFLTFPLTPQTQTVYWGGANDGTLHYPLRINTLLLVDSDPNARLHAGTILWKQPTLIYPRQTAASRLP